MANDNFFTKLCYLIEQETKKFHVLQSTAKIIKRIPKNY